MNKTIFGFILLLSFNQSYSQVLNKTWYFGDGLGLKFDNINPTIITGLDHVSREGTTTVSDETGKLLFYIDHDQAYSNNFSVIENGNNLTGNENLGGSAQTPIVVQNPADKTQFYVLFLSDHVTNNLVGDFKYAIVDMCNFGDSEKVIEKNLLVPGDHSERMTVVEIQKGKSYWILTTKLETKELLAYKLDENGINLSPIVSTLNNLPEQIIGKIEVNNARNKLAWSTTFGSENGLWLADFDILSGTISNSSKLLTGTTYGIRFTPNDKYLYFTNTFTTSSINRVNLETMAQETLLSIPVNYAAGAINLGPFNRYLYILDRTNKRILRVDQIEGLNPMLETYHQFNANENIGLGLQNQVIHYGIATDTIISGTSNSILYVCDSSLLLNVNSVDAIWSTGETGPAITATTSGTYWSKYRDCENLYIDTITIEFNHAQTIVTDTFVSLCQDSVVLHSNGEEVEWSTGETSNSITVFAAGSYTASYKNTECLSTLINFEVTQDLIPITILNDTLICPGEQTILVSNHINSLWNDNSTGETLTITEQGTYSAEYMNDSCQFVTELFEVSYNDEGNTITIQDTVVVCDFFDVSNFIQEGYELLINDNITSDEQISIEGTLYYFRQSICTEIYDSTLIIIENNPIPLQEDITFCTEDFAPIILAQNQEVFWNDSLTSANFQIDQAGIYYYSIENSCGFFTDSIKIELLEPQSISIDTIVHLCNDSLELYYNDDVINWSTGQNSSIITVDSIGTYTASYGVSECLSVEINFEVVSDLIPISIIKDTMICFGTQARLLSMNPNALWNDNSVGIELLITEEGSYTAEYIGDSCQYVTEFFNVTYFTETENIQLPDTIIACNSYDISSYIENGFELSFNNEIIIDENLLSEGILHYYRQDDCSNIFDSTLIIIETPPILLPEDVVLCKQELDTLQLNQNQEVLWNDLLQSNTYQIYDPGTYFYFLENACGIYSDTINIIVNKEININTIANIFSPNGDGNNDYFPKNVQELDFIEFKIFDRWGNLVHDNPKEPWDGEFKSSRGSNMVYAYLIKYNSCGETKIKIGDVTTIR